MSQAPRQVQTLADLTDVPKSTSSKRLLAEMEADKNQARLLDIDIETEAKKLRAAGSFDSRYWTKLKEVSELRSKRSMVGLRLLNDEVDDESPWKENEEAKRLEEEERLHSLEAAIYKKQASRVEITAGDQAKNRKGYIMQLWTTSTKGLGIFGTEKGRGSRPGNIQERFKDELIIACKSRSGDAKSDELWCPILGHYFPQENVHAAHIFPWAEGQVAMDEIFGIEDEKEELSDIHNGLMLSEYAEQRIEEGDIVLVPDVSNDASRKEIDAWSKAEPKEYKIRVTNSKAKGMDRYHPGNALPRKTWNDLDGKKVQFLSDHRPRARYLYWQYCKTMLRHAWQEKGTKAEGVLMQERRKQFWGTKGPYMKKRMLLAFVEQLGHDYEALMENAIVETADDNIPESDPSALLLASTEIRMDNRKHSDDSDEEGEDSSDDEDTS